MTAAPPVDPVAVVTTARTPAGLLSWAAWEALRGAPVRLTTACERQRAALEGAGVRVLEDPAPAEPAPDEALVLVLDRDEDAALLALLAGRGVRVLDAPPDLPGARLLDAVAVMDRLRSPGGCPWDAEQTHASLARYLLEEAWEAHEALETGDLVGLREELGDVLLQVLFSSRIAQELAEPWSVDDVAAGLVDKLVRRHPHVFAGAPADDLERAWERSKAAEKGRRSVTEGVPLGQPALALAAALQRRARRLGAPVPPAEGPGGALWELVRRCAEEGVDPEEALRAVARAYRDALAAAEARVRASGDDPAGLGAEQWQAAWAQPVAGSS